MALVVNNPPANAGDIWDMGSIPESGRSLGGGHGNPFQYSCLENPMDRGAWWATVHKGLKESDMHWRQIIYHLSYIFSAIIFFFMSHWFLLLLFNTCLYCSHSFFFFFCQVMPLWLELHNNTSFSYLSLKSLGFSWHFLVRGSTHHNIRKTCDHMKPPFFPHFFLESGDCVHVPM